MCSHVIWSMNQPVRNRGKQQHTVCLRDVSDPALPRCFFGGYSSVPVHFDTCDSPRFVCDSPGPRRACGRASMRFKPPQLHPDSGEKSLFFLRTKKRKKRRMNNRLLLTWKTWADWEPDRKKYHALSQMLVGFYANPKLERCAERIWELQELLKVDATSLKHYLNPTGPSKVSSSAVWGVVHLENIWICATKTCWQSALSLAWGECACIKPRSEITGNTKASSLSLSPVEELKMLGPVETSLET